MYFNYNPKTFISLGYGLLMIIILFLKNNETEIIFIVQSFAIEIRWLLNITKNNHWFFKYSLYNIFVIFGVYL